MRSITALRIAAHAVRIMLIALIAGPGSAHAQAYPTKPIRFIVPNGMGGTTDTIARSIAQRMSDDLGQQVVVDNRPGSGGIIGSELVARASPDGYTLLMGTIGNLAISPHLYKRIGYDPLRDFSPVAQIAASAYMLVVNPSMNARSTKELVAAARAKPGSFNYASAGSGTGSHLTMELFRSIARIDLIHIPYKGGTPGLTDLIAGQIHVMFNGIPSTMPHVRSNRLRALAVTTSKRSPAAPELMTIAEAGFPGAESTSWTALLVPAGTPAAIIERLNGALGKVIRTAEVRRQLLNDGAEPVGSSPAELAAYLKRELARWGDVVRASGAKAN